jgi:hypothetical protein
MAVISWLPGWAVAQACDALPHDVYFCDQAASMSLIQDLSGKGGLYAYFSDQGAHVSATVTVSDFPNWQKTDQIYVYQRSLRIVADTAKDKNHPFRVLTEDQQSMAGQTVDRAVWLSDSGEGDYVTARSIYMGPGYVLMVITTDLGHDFTEEHKRAHLAALNNIHLGAPPAQVAPANAAITACHSLSRGVEICGEPGLVLENVSPSPASTGIVFSLAGVRMTAFAADLPDANQFSLDTLHDMLDETIASDMGTSFDKIEFFFRGKMPAAAASRDAAVSIYRDVQTGRTMSQAVMLENGYVVIFQAGTLDQFLSEDHVFALEEALRMVRLPG